MSEREEPASGSSNGNVGQEPDEAGTPVEGTPSEIEVPRPQRIQFTGRGSEYFGIWIVNVLLSIITLGIWSAWAKVRRLQYFNGHTIMLGNRLEYHATGWMIFKGRFIAFVVLAVVSAASNYLALLHPIASLVPGLMILALYPWVINRSLKFKARMTTWRNVRFNWHGTYWGAVKNFLLWPVAGVLTIGILYPLAARAIRHYIANNHSFGKTNFSAHTNIKPYYVAFGQTILFFLSIITFPILSGLLGGAIGLLGDAMAQESSSSEISMDQAATLPILIAILVLYSGSVFTILTRNIIVNALTLGDAATFTSDLKALRYFWILLSNLIVSILTLFLMHPWAQVRAYRYQAEGITVEPKVRISEFVDQEEKQVAAFGEEFGEFEGLDVSI